MTSRGRLAERSEVTRGKLLAAARELFAERGYAETSTEDVVRRAKVTRGALYHHFRGKDEIFRALYETLEAELAQRSMIAAAKGRDPLEMLHLGIEAYLDACLEPEVQRILLLDGLSVLGWETWHAIGVKYNWGLIKAAIEAAIANGLIESRPAEELTHVIQGGLIQAGMMLARAGDPAAARAATGAEIRRMIESLRRARRSGRRR